ncbi:MAG: UDP-N-acetylmuramoyl-L-alanyl-D-glutamate--2,6-diaminopimelate ligase [Acidobacteriota bacterium]|nr:UDP-N-acetylmuramoyl-L-alanyl-D-glutamate--2,6-diaminopimelate ligase [Acidobacteriota bacterium]
MERGAKSGPGVGLEELVRGLPLESPEAPVNVRGVTHDSRSVEPGDLFVALVGEQHDGRRYAQQAVQQGAVAVLGEGNAPPKIDVPWIAAKADPRTMLGPLAARIYGHPDREMTTVGVTGTNGKSTVTALAAAVLDAAGRPAGMIGTLGYRFRDLSFPGERTTPEASDLFRMLRRMVDAGARAAAIEVSSHALAMGRVAGAAFDVAVFTNLTRDHFDFHDGFEDYFAAKRRIFDQLKDGGRAVVCIDDPYGRRLAEEIPGALTYGENGEVRLSDVQLGADGSRAVAHTPRGDLRFKSPLVGSFNLANLTAVVAVAEALELPHEAVMRGFEQREPLPGRLEPVKLPSHPAQGSDRPARDLPVQVYIDFAHTPAALEALLVAARQLTHEQLVLVFGCGGDRDPGKRPQMGEIAGKLADLPIVTSDNPRTEDPLAIIADVEQGLKASGNTHYRVMPDRHEAIRRAVAVAQPGAVVLVAGKGCEEYQIVGERRTPFSDREEIVRALEDRFGRDGGR